MSKTTHAIYTVLAVILVVFIWVQVSINGQVNRSLANHCELISSLNDSVSGAYRNNSETYCFAQTSHWETVRVVNELMRVQLKHVDAADKFVNAQRAELAAVRTALQNIRLDAAADRETVRVMSSLFAERLKDHATLFAMTGKLSESVASLTNLIRVVEAQEVRK